jgi:hypothetical protein
MRASTRRARLLVAGLLLLAISGCESSQDLNKKLAKRGAAAIAHDHGLVITVRNRDVQILHTAVVTDSNGTAAVVILRNRKPHPLGSVPLAINVLGAGGKSVFRNNSPGLEPSLVSASALAPRGELEWVDDQVTPSGAAVSVKAEAGVGGRGAPSALPKIVVGRTHLMTDPTSGLEAVGMITNQSSVSQLRLFVYVVAWRGNHLLAAGRGAIARLAAGAHSTYHVYLIGNPNGAPLDVAAPPTVLR